MKVPISPKKKLVSILRKKNGVKCKKLLQKIIAFPDTKKEVA